MNYKARILQGGFTWRKLLGWIRETHRYKGRVVLLCALGICPFYREIAKFDADLVAGVYNWYNRLFRPVEHLTWNINIRVRPT
jgi:hypothetical protein